MADNEIEDGGTYTTSMLRNVATSVRDEDPADGVDWFCVVLFEALAKTKDDLAAAVETAAQLRKEFDALKSTIRHDGR